MESEHPTHRILKRILPLMPTKHRNSDEEAEEMRRKMNAIVEEEFPNEKEYQDEIPF